ncbi:unnamed protein product [Caenorhabditis sp. 36 PRJEB53466]|nr:unnamed protein product [Caenorhabditis sp. 36 PRJEB53466]
MDDSDHCAVMESLSGSLVLRFSLIFCLLCSLVALPLILMATYAIWCARVSSLFHINVIIIFQVHLFGFFLHCSARIVLHSLDLFNYAVYDYCDMAPSVWRCFVFRFLYISGLWMVCSTTVPLVVERYIATRKASNYEHTGCALGLAMVVLQILLASIPTYIAFSNFKFDDPVMNYCMAIKVGQVSSNEKLAAGSILVQILSRILFHYLFKVNEKLRKKQSLTSSLSNRYSLEQNLKSMRTLKRFADLQTGFMVIHITIFIFLLRYGPEITKSLYISLVELNAPYPIYAVVSIVALLQTAHLNRVKLKNKLHIHVNTDQSVYFENFRKDLS